MIEIGMDTALTALGAVVEGKESFVYKVPRPMDGCVYVDYDEQYDPAKGRRVKENLRPSCLVGTALHHLGLPLEVFIDEGVNSGKDVVDIYRKLNGTHFTMSEEAMEVLLAAQTSQDRGEPWETALSAAAGRAAGIRANQDDD